MTGNFCDGTGIEIPEDSPKLGPYGRQYAECIRPLVEQYLAELAEIRERYRRVLAQLPDDPPQ